MQSPALARLSELAKEAGLVLDLGDGAKTEGEI